MKTIKEIFGLNKNNDKENDTMNKKAIPENITTIPVYKLKENAKPKFVDYDKINDVWLKSTIKNGIREMERTGWPFFYAHTPVAKIYDTPYQREVDQRTIRRIIREFDPILVENIILNFNCETNQLENMDGRHTMTALSMLSIESCYAKIYVGLDKHEQAKVFANQYKKKRRLSSYDEYKAHVWADEDPAKTIKEIAAKFGVTVSKTRAPKTVTSLRKLVAIVNRYGKEGLEYTFQIIRDANWEDYSNAYVESILNIGLYTYPLCKDNECRYNTLIETLSKTTPTDYIEDAIKENKFTNISHPESSTGTYAASLVSF
jgi:hypothetical protein